MAGFFDFMTKMVNGEPIFDAADQNPSRSDEPDSQQQPAIRKNDDSSFPVVYVKRVKTHVNGGNMEVYCLIRSNWHEEIVLDKIRLLGTMRELDATLPTGGEQDFLVYRGPKLQKESHEALLDYKTRHEGDYFQAVHDVKCTYHADDKTYSVTDMRLQEPIRDIYG